MELQNGKYITDEEFKERGVEYIYPDPGTPLKFLPHVQDNHMKLLTLYMTKINKDGEFICESEVPEVKSFFAEKALKDLKKLEVDFEAHLFFLKYAIEKVKGHMEQWKRHINEMNVVLNKTIIDKDKKI